MNDDPPSAPSGPAPSFISQFSESELQKWKQALIEITPRGTTRRRHMPI